MTSREELIEEAAKAHAPIEDEPPICGVEHPFNGHVCSLRDGHAAGHICDRKRPDLPIGEAS